MLFLKHNRYNAEGNSDMDNNDDYLYVLVHKKKFKFIEKNESNESIASTPCDEQITI